MEKGIRMSYETIGASSYMVAFCAPEVELVHFKLEMLLANDMKNVMKMTRQMIDGETVIYYNITSKIPLKQMLNRRKLSRQELLSLIDGGIEAIRDAADYGLAESGFVLEPDYIYVNPASCAPSFMYLPLQGQAGMTLKELISDLILHDRIEMTNDNFIQALLKELNRQPFSMEQLQKSLRRYQSGSPLAERDAKIGRIGDPAVEKAVFHESQIPKPEITDSGIRENNNSGVSDHNNPRDPKIPGRKPEEKKEEMASAPSKGKLPQLPKSGGRKKEKEQPAKKEKKKVVSASEETDEEDGFDAEKAKKKFMLPQALIMILLAASVSFGLFLDEAGNIVINNVLAVVIVVVITEIILYRETYVNSKAPKKTKGKKMTSPQKNTKKKGSKPEKSSRPEVPSGSAPSGTSRPPVPSVSERTPHAENSVRQSIPLVNQPVSPPVIQPESEYVRQSLPSAVLSKPQHEAYRSMGSGISGYENYASAADPGYGNTDDTELNEDGSNGIGMAYLEYFENGKITRISLDRENGVVVGRLRTEVDFAVRSPRVGKIHARFYGRDGRFYVVDINSKNGTYVNGNGMRIESNVPYLLHDKDRVMLADCEFTIRCPEY